MQKSNKKEEIQRGSQVRYQLSYAATRRLMNDFIRFKHRYSTEFENEFLCRILTNFLEYIQREKVLGLESEIEKVINGHNVQKTVYTNGKLFATASLSDKTTDFRFYDSPHFKKSKTFSFILEKYASMSFSDREKIYFYDIYCQIQDNLQDSQPGLLKIEYEEKPAEKATYVARPYDLILDDNSFSFYLIGYAKKKGDGDKERIRSLALNRICSCKTICLSESTFNPEKKSELEKVLSQMGPAYIQECKNPSETVVRLSPQGYDLFLTTIVRQRPIPIAEPEPDNEKKGYYILKFDCSFKQIRNYFFSYGDKAEILSPLKLRNKFITDLQNALACYEDK